MPAFIDLHLRAALPVPVPLAEATPSTAPASVSDQAKRKDERDARIGRWKAIGEAGGIEEWVAAQLTAKGLSTESIDPSTLSDKEKNQYKEKKKAEAAERRALRRQAWQAYHATHIVHLGSGVHWDERTTDKFDLKKRESREQDNGLPVLLDAAALAEALGMPLARLRWMTYQREVDTGTHYRSWTIPKRDGSQRTITAPKKDLKAAQRWTLRNIVEKLPVHSAAHGFVPGRSIVSNAVRHAGAEVIVKVDIKDFFPTVTWKRVKGLLRKAGMREKVATLVALLATESPRETVEFRGKTLFVATGPRALPQGAPTSPGITNALCLGLDKRMSGLARKLGCRYSRYADDLTFSWRSKTSGTKAPVAQLLLNVNRILLAEGFRPHPTKTRVMRNGSRQSVTGLVVNQSSQVPAARVPRETVRQLRAAIHNREQGKKGKPGESLEQLRGLAAFVFMTDRERGHEFLQRIEALERRAQA